MRTMIAAVVAGLVAAFAVAAEDPAGALARGKLEADLGHPVVAAEAFASVAQAAQATEPQRWEALVRLGVARRDAGDAKGSVAAFADAFRRYGKDEEALRFLILAVGGAVPGQERWDEVWRQVTLDVDRRDADHPVVRVQWPGVPLGLCPCTGSPVDLDFKDGDYQDIFRLFADISGMNVVVQPGTHGRVTYRTTRTPWDEVLEQLLAPNGLVARIQGNVVVDRPARGSGRAAVVRRQADPHRVRRAGTSSRCCRRWLPTGTPPSRCRPASRAASRSSSTTCPGTRRSTCYCA